MLRLVRPSLKRLALDLGLVGVVCIPLAHLVVMINKSKGFISRSIRVEVCVPLGSSLILYNLF